VTPETRPYSRLVGSLFGTLKLLQMYGTRHDASADALDNLAAAIRDAAAGEDEVSVAVRGSRLQVNGRVMRAAECGNLALAFLAEEWTRRGLRGVKFAATVPSADLGTFGAAFLDLDTNRPEPAARLHAAIATSGIDTIKLEAREEKEEDPVALEDRREMAMRTYLRSLRAFKEVLRCEGFSDRTRLRRARRAVQGLVDRFLEDESAVLALAQIRGHDVKLFHHSLHVCIYSLVLGQRLGMNRRQLGALGLAALFHDVGKTVTPPPRTPPTPPLDEVREHPVRGARLLFEEGSAHEGMLKAAIAAYEHHVHFGGGGFPAIDHAPHAVSRIIAIADCYEALTSPREYRPQPYSSAEAMNILHAKSGTLFDPLLLRVFAAAIGAYPVGSIVELSTGEIALVTEASRDPKRGREPKVRIMRSSSGLLPREAALDLAAAPEEGQPRRTVVRQVPQEEIFGTAGEFVSAI